MEIFHSVSQLKPLHAPPPPPPPAPAPYYPPYQHSFIPPPAAEPVYLPPALPEPQYYDPAAFYDVVPQDGYRHDHHRHSSIQYVIYSVAFIIFVVHFKTSFYLIYWFFSDINDMNNNDRKNATKNKKRNNETKREKNKLVIEIHN